MGTTDSDADAIAAVRQGLEAAENAFDADAAGALMADDVVCMVPDFPVQEGKEASVAFMRDIMGWSSAHFERHVTYVSAEVVITGDQAFDRGAFSFRVTPRSGGDTEEVTGKYLWLLRRTSHGAWRVTRLILSRDGPEDDGE
jgi:ketosteroid isomerase-like protein